MTWADEGTEIPGGDHCTALGEAMHALARELWPIPRSISGAGLRQTLGILGKQLPGLVVHEVASGSRALDWIVPEEWWVNDAWIETPSGQRICQFTQNNLHLLGYSTGVDAHLPLHELNGYLHSLPEQPDAIPYVTSYYQRRWGFCLSHRQRMALEPGTYRVFVDAGHRAGAISYGECLIPGESPTEVLLSTYCCHPSMANNELSGPVLLTFLGAWLAALPRRRLSWRLLFIPEMIGSVAWLERNLEHARKQIRAGLNLSCLGDERAWGYLPSRHGDTEADRITRDVLGRLPAGFKSWSWLDRGSDESNYCAPGIDLPIASVFRSKYGSYPEYHTSLDDLEHVVTPRGLAESFRVMRSICQSFDERISLPSTAAHAGIPAEHLQEAIPMASSASNEPGIRCDDIETLSQLRPRVRVLGEPQLGRRGLYPSLSMKGSTRSVRCMLDLLSYADGTRSLREIAETIRRSLEDLIATAALLNEHQLLDFCMHQESARTDA